MLISTRIFFHRKHPYYCYKKLNKNSIFFIFYSKEIQTSVQLPLVPYIAGYIALFSVVDGTHAGQNTKRYLANKKKYYKDL